MTADSSSPTTEELIDAYTAAAAAHGALTQAGDYRLGNAKADEVAAIYRIIRSQGIEAQTALLDLLRHPDSNVCLWAAAHALEFAPEEGERTLAELAASAPGLMRLNAETTLVQWRQGQLEFP